MFNREALERYARLCASLGLSRIEAAHLVGMNYHTFKGRLRLLEGVVWAYESGGPHRKCAEGVSHLAELFGIPRRRIADRLRSGKTLFEACHAR